jgi:hypothetical protein
MDFLNRVRLSLTRAWVSSARDAANSFSQNPRPRLRSHRPPPCRGRTEGQEQGTACRSSALTAGLGVAISSHQRPKRGCTAWLWSRRAPDRSGALLLLGSISVSFDLMNETSQDHRDLRETATQSASYRFPSRRPGSVVSRSRRNVEGANTASSACPIPIGRTRIGDVEDSLAIDEPDAGGKFGLCHPLAQRN